MHVDKKSPIPVYFQLKNILLKKVQDGEFPAGGLIPSERDLCESLGISRMTVRQALSQLVAEGVLYREKGRGTFVAKSKIEQRNIMSFSDLVTGKGLVPSTKVLYFGKNEADAEIRGFLGLREGEMVFTVKRLRLASSVPVGIEEVSIPEKYCPDLDRYDLTASLYRLMKTEYGFEVDHVDNVIESSRPGREEKELLEIPNTVPVLRIAGVIYTGSGLKLFHERSVYRSDEYKYNVRVYVHTNIE